MQRSASIGTRHFLQTDFIAMLSHLYRFRSIYAVIDRSELSNQEIYFAPSEKLNDPMEGYKDVFWSGDLIVWRNLLRHYLLCLLRSAFAMGADLDGAQLKTLRFLRS